MARKAKKTVSDKFEEITASIVASLEKGVAPWVCPWDRNVPGGMMPHNGLTGRHYNGINIFLCWATGYLDPRWYTFDQAMVANGFKAKWETKKRYGKVRKVKTWEWAGEGEEPCSPWECGVRKGEKSPTFIVHWHRVTKREENEDGEEEERSWMTLKTWRVFNHAQIDWAPGMEPGRDETVTTDAEANEAAQKLFEALDAKLSHGGNRAAYSPQLDIIQMPEVKAFPELGDYWSTRAHETVHWTGHGTRCARKLDAGRFGSEAYAFEELVAEMGAAFLAAELGLTGKLQHAEYIGHWIKVLKSDNKALFKAASLAREAVEFIRAKAGLPARTYEDNKDNEDTTTAKAA